MNRSRQAALIAASILSIAYVTHPSLPAATVTAPASTSPTAHGGKIAIRQILKLPTRPVAASTVTSSNYTIREATWLSSKAARCIEWNESTNGKLSANVWQFEGMTWTTMTGLRSDPGLSSRAVQDDAAYRLFLQHGWRPWSTRFVCGLA